MSGPGKPTAPYVPQENEELRKIEDRDHWCIYAGLAMLWMLSNPMASREIARDAEDAEEEFRAMIAEKRKREGADDAD